MAEFHKMPNMLDPTAWVQTLVDGDYELVHVWLGGPNSDQAELKFKKRSPENVLDPPRSDGKARGVSTAYARDHPEGPPDFDG